MTTCKYCRSTRLVKRRKEPHIGIYCVACGKWQQWVKQNSPKFEAIPWDLCGKSLKQLIGDDPIVYVPEDTIFSPEEYKAVIEARFPTKAKIVEAHSDPDKPPWED